MGSNKVIMKNNIDFKKIDQLLKDKKMTYKDLAAAMGRGSNMLSTWKRSGGISQVAMPLLCNILDCNAEICDRKN